LFTLPLVAVILLMPRLGRYSALATNFLAFSYFKQKLKADLAEYRENNPTAHIVTRPWYRGLPLALAGMIAFLTIFILLSLLLYALGVPEG